MRRVAAFACSFLLLAACSSDGGNGSSATSATSGATTTAAVAATDAPTTTVAATTTTEAPRQYAATIDELLAIGRPIVLAHTAGEDNFPASTMFAFGESVKAGVDMLDMNVMLTKDGVLVVQHDDTVDGSTNGKGAVGDLTYDEIRPLDDAYWFTAECGVCHQGQPESAYLYRGIRTGDVPPPVGYTADDFAMPTFKELVERYPDIPLNIEIKGEGAPAKAAADQLYKELVELGRSDASVVASFNDEIVSYFHSIAPDIEVSPGLNVLTGYVLNGTPIPDGMRILQLPPEFNGLQVITPKLIATTKAAGYPIWIWPNNRDLENLASYRTMLDEGIDGLNINFPAQGVQAVQEYVELSAVAAAPSAGCNATPFALPADATIPFTAAGFDGTFVQHLPPAYNGTTPLPLVIDLHGWSEPAAVHVVFSGLGAFGDVHRFVTLTPEITRPVALWDTALDGGDMQWMTALLDQAEATLCVDTNRVYFAGMSNGAMMTTSVACALSDRVAAAAPVAGIRNPEGCTFTRPVPLVAFHGTDDGYLAYEGGYGPKVAGLPDPSGTGTLGTAVITSGANDQSVPEMVQAWAVRNGCEDSAPAESDAASDVTLLTFSCPPGADAVLYRINGGGHAWPGSAVSAGAVDLVGFTTMTISADELLWDFFRHHPLGA